MVSARARLSVGRALLAASVAVLAVSCGGRSRAEDSSSRGAPGGAPGSPAGSSGASSVEVAAAAGAPDTVVCGRTFDEPDAAYPGYEAEAVCGDGRLGPTEACDDGNADDADGCSGDCTRVERGWVCTAPGVPCIPWPWCGDGIVDANETCDDDDTASGDGCDERCRVEDGWVCEGEPSTCRRTVCGDGVVEGSESCDNASTSALDDCSADCQLEYQCDNDFCDASCGDLVREALEECDDGNLRDGDGCAADCTIERGFTCQSSGRGSDCSPICGDGLVVPGEACDYGRGPVAWGFTGCTDRCEHPAYCGDAIVQPEHLEQCDDGLLGNRGDYGGCRFDCQLAPRCGDGNVDTLYDEQCDPGDGCTDAYCSQDCKIIHPL